MNTYKAGTKKANTLFARLTPTRQQELLTLCQQKPVLPSDARVIQFDTTGKENEQVVSVFFGMDLCRDSKYVYLFPDEVAA